MSGALFADVAGKLTIPDEILSTSGIGTGLSNGGAAAFSGASAVRANPAMLALEKTYAISAGYHWPAIGSDFYRLGVIDSKTSDIAAGLTFVRPTEKFEQLRKESRNGDLLLPLKSRLALGFGYTLNRVAVGLSGQIIEAYEAQTDSDQISRIRGNTLGLGLAGLLTPSIRAAISAENLANRQVAYVAPRFIRAGIAYLTPSGTLSTHLDYLNRAALVPKSAGSTAATQSLGLIAAQLADSDAAQSEQQVVASFTAKAYDLLRLVGSYGAVVENRRQMFGGGVALVNRNWTFSYMAMRPDTRITSAHQAVSLEINVAL
jgi:hypothetical protein